jgi:hypothetical protein
MVQPDPIAIVGLSVSVVASLKPIDVPGPDRYQIVSPCSPSTSLTLW